MGRALALLLLSISAASIIAAPILGEAAEHDAGVKHLSAEDQQPSPVTAQAPVSEKEEATKGQLREGRSLDKPVREPAVAKQPVILAKKEDPSEIPKMPTTYPFSPKHDDNEHKEDDPQQKTENIAVQKHLDVQDYTDKHPVVEGGEQRPWDPLNDFLDPADKVAATKRITDNIDQMATRPVKKLLYKVSSSNKL